MGKAKSIVGVEIDEGWCKLQQRIIDQFQFEDRVEIFNSDIMSAKSLQKLAKADLTVMHNPFEWFAKDGGETAYKTILSSLKSGAKVVSMPSIESHNIDVSKWLKNVTP